MSRKHKKHRHQNQGRTKSVMNPAAPGRNGLKGGKQGRKTGLILVAALVVIAAVVAFALNAAKSPREVPGPVAPVAAANPPLPTPVVPQQPLLSTSPSGGLIASGSGPRIQFATPVHDFGQIKGGEVVKYTYVFTNAGQQLLEVTAVQASCGCTTAGDWSRQVEPGQTGRIPIEFNSGSFNGQVAKSITVTCNDPTQPTVALQLKATIWRPIDVTPQFAVLNLTSESPSNATTVRIVSNEESPLTVSAPESSNPAFAAELKTNQPGKEFELVVKTVPPLPAGNFQGQITLRTSSTNLPVINVTALANVLQTVMVAPSQITLPAAPLANPMPSNVVIRNNGTNALVLTEPTVNAKGVDVQLTEPQPGRYFTLTVTFPKGFEIIQGEKIELSVKSNHPQFPVIKVPILQPPRPVATAAPGQVVPPTSPPAAAQPK